MCTETKMSSLRTFFFTESWPFYKFHCSRWWGFHQKDIAFPMLYCYWICIHVIYSSIYCKKTLLSPGSTWRSCTVMTSCARVDRIRSLLPVMHLICYWPPLVLEAVKCKERPCNQGDDEKRINIHSCLIIIHTYIHTYISATPFTNMS